MKCNNLIIQEERRRKGSGKPYMKIVKRSNWSFEKIHGNSIKDAFPDCYEKFEKCDGNVVPSVDKYYAPDCCCDPEIEIRYRCDKCNETFFPELPGNEEGIQKLVEEYISKISNTKQNALRRKYAAEEKSRQDELLKWRKEYEDMESKRKSAAKKRARKKKVKAKSKK